MAPSFAATGLHRSLNWTVRDLPCPDGTVPTSGGQAQSVVPLGDASGLLLMGSAPLCQGIAPSTWTPDWYVYDVSSGTPVLVDAFDDETSGFNVGAHSPRGSSVGFGVEGSALVTYDGGFHSVDLSSGVFGVGVWAAPPTSIWVVGSVDQNSYGPGSGRIVHYDGDSRRVEYEGNNRFWQVWGFGTSALFASYQGYVDVDNNIDLPGGLLQRQPDGSWTPVELPDGCEGGRPAA